MSEIEGFSLQWQNATGGRWTAGENYEIAPRPSSWELRYRGTLLHIGLSATECMREADRHRGISR